MNVCPALESKAFGTVPHFFMSLFYFLAVFPFCRDARPMNRVSTVTNARGPFGL